MDLLFLLPSTKGQGGEVLLQCNSTREVVVVLE
jgi:hypothetical protein